MDERLLDRIAAKRAQRIVNQASGPAEPQEVDNLVTKALGVFQENGVYAGFLFLFSRTRDKDKKIAEAVREQLIELSSEDLPFGWGEPRSMDAQNVLEYVSDTVCRDLDPLLMTKELFEQTLIYARYGAKARK
jgi:hypothetical protein